jgi:uncharacterized membrane protein YfcA
MFLLYLVVGAIAGVLAGLFGVGGGMIIVPVLIFTFAAQGVSDSVATHMAVATSLATIVFTSMSSVWEHHRNGAIDWRHCTGRVANNVCTWACIAKHHRRICITAFY